MSSTFIPKSKHSLFTLVPASLGALEPSQGHASLVDPNGAFPSSTHCHQFVRP